ncbi:unnamed protein product [Brassicogethes aeneus]|uniref:THO complex subunit 5 n=1 Tax=Brassicogethes aeneus TaxID=1431903 RepID=A0A9P0FN29_BRAAE|nr:unnamed protein product [Brassicogethes aeneus]
MVKDTTPIKKKRKTANSGDNDAETDIYRKVVEFEEKESKLRSSEGDAQIYSNICADIRKKLAEMMEINSEVKQEGQRKQELLLDVCLKIAVIKKLNRVDKIQHVFGKDLLNVEKQKCDSIKLVYQNLVYELGHLMHEVTKCNSFKSKHEDIDLIDFSDFMKGAPSDITDKFKNVDMNNSEDLHNLTLARLEYELQQRKSLAKSYETLQEEKKKLAEDIVERKKKLDGLLPLLNTIINATKPLQEYLNIPIDKVRAEHKLAQLLPDPLYIFYANVVAYSSVHDVNLKANILGDQEEAAQFNENECNNEEIESDGENETQETEEVVEVKKRRHRKSVQVDPMEEKKKKILELHPLSVEVTLDIKDVPSITLLLKYCMKLKIVTVTSKVNLPSDITGNCAQEILSGENILNELTPGDFGLESPNPGTPYLLKKVGLGSFRNLVSQLGYAYKWVQTCCGLDFLDKKAWNEEIGRANVEFVFKTLNKRLTSRTTLAKQLEKLEQKSIPQIPDSIEKPQNVISNLTKFGSTTYQDFCMAKHTKALLDEDFINPSDLFFTATISRSSAHLNCFIVIKNDYPISQPIFSLNLIFNKQNLSAENSDQIRDMEKAINLEIKHDSASLLAIKFTFLCSYLDVLLETNFPKDFPQSTMFLKNISGRNRRNPFKFRKIGTGIFTQY